MEKCQEIYEIKYTKGGNVGTIKYFPQHDTEEDKPYLAVTPTMSKWYKTESGAKMFMNTRGYTPAKK